MTECEQCGEPCADNAKACPWSGLMLCGECAYDEGIQAEERFLGTGQEPSPSPRGPSSRGYGTDASNICHRAAPTRG